ncbi:AUXIN-RESPONSIVE PROTEIN [Salix viminalis]|uniref:AUXIN-RESPONSIVE PROTEIN n=1 Tax=Salix viminalis TaxID=40686 RepID=A0A9Q0NQD0_SALVM|nr:AUXIN-RESPONSIVE PROTEIN [Salix viminalis]
MGVLSFCFFVFWVSQVVSAQKTSDPNEVDALNKLIDYWDLRDKLNITTDPCIKNAEWANEQANPRVACDCSSTTCHITHLKIYGLDISGEIPSELFVLKELVKLDFGQNILNGTIPAEIEQLSNLQNLNLSINNFTGEVPQELGNLTKLITLGLGSNNFVGPLPPSLGKLTSLQELYVDSSGVSGPIPREFENLKSLQTLWASDNLFTGKLPDFFGDLTELRNLYGVFVLRISSSAAGFKGTLLEGPIPSSFSALKKLEDLRIGDLKGEDSALEFLLDQKSLTILVLRNCLLSGQIPDRLGKLFPVTKNCQIPDSFQDLALLQYLYLGNNSLNGQLPANIIGPNLTAIDVSFNPISGDLPQNSMKVGLSMNVVGTSINANNLQGKASGMLQCLQADFKCSNKVSSKSFSVKCGGMNQTSASGIEYEGDFESIGAASLYTSSENLWAGEIVLKDFNIKNEAVSDGAGSSRRDKKRLGKLVGISAACVAGLVIISSVFYLWWIKEDSPRNMRI